MKEALKKSYELEKELYKLGDSIIKWGLNTFLYHAGYTIHVDDRDVSFYWVAEEVEITLESPYDDSISRMTLPLGIFNLDPEEAGRQYREYRKIGKASKNADRGLRNMRGYKDIYGEAWNTTLKKSYNFLKEIKRRHKKQRRDIWKGWENVQHTETTE